MNILEDLRWRYATKKFNPDKKPTEEQLQILLEAMDLTPTSYGLQAMEVVLVKDPGLRKQLAGASFGQVQIATAPYIIVLAHYERIGEKFIDDYLKNISSARNIPLEKLESKKKLIQEILSRMDPQQVHEWLARQCYIVLGVLLTACADQRIDSCPMEGVEKDQYDKILGFDKLGLKTTVVIPVGYRAEDDDYQYQTKIRRPLREFIIVK